MFGHHAPAGKKKVCAICDTSFETVLVNELGEFCVDCRTACDMRSNKDAAEWLTYMDKCMPAERAGKVKERQAANPRKGTAIAVQKVDQEKVAEAIRGMVQYGGTAHDAAGPTMPTAYVIHAGGLAEVRHTDLADITIAAPKVIVGMTKTLTSGVRLNVPKIPYQFLTQTIAFFRGVCDAQKGSSEAFVQIWWNTVDKVWSIHVPEQSVSGASVNHRSTFDQENERREDGGSKWLYGMDIHSHGSSMGAFWSSVDDADESKAPEGRMFGVIGNVKQLIPTWRWRMRTREGFIDLNVADLFEVDATITIPFNVTMKVVLSQMNLADSKGIKDGNVVLECPVDAFGAATFPKEWLEAIKPHFQRVHGHHSGFVHQPGQAQQQQVHQGGTSGFQNGYIFILNPARTGLDEYEFKNGVVGDKTGTSVLLEDEHVITH